MTLKDILAERLPFLRRYARALSGSQESGDAFVRELLEAAIADEDLRAEIGESRVHLYRAFTRVWWSGFVDATVDSGEDVDPYASGIDRIPPERRQALLLTTLEDFTLAEAAAILNVSEDEAARLVAEAVAEIDAESATQVLIIEDEPLIAMQLESLVSDLGHEVVATATTHREAVEAYTRTRPGLVLADIQLADQSSGIDAVEDILALGPVPVVFITAYPERLLTGERPEPTYLVTKPFREETVRAAISQALFFDKA